MRFKPIFYKFKGKNYATNCALGNHKACAGVIGLCECGCHFGKSFPPYIAKVREMKNKLEREKYAKLTKQQLEKRNRKINNRGKK